MKWLARILAHFAPRQIAVTPVHGTVLTLPTRRQVKPCLPAPSYADAVEELRREQEIEAELRAQGEPSAASKRIARDIAALNRPTAFTRKLRSVKS